MTKLRCIPCLEKGVVSELNFRKNGTSDPAYYMCPKCGLKTFVDYGETGGGDKLQYMPMPKLDLESEESLPEEALDNLLEHYIRRRFKN